MHARNKFLVVVAVVFMMVAPVGVRVALAAEAELMAKERLSGSRTFCVDIEWRDTPNYLPALYLNIGFEANTSGYFEVNHTRVYSWVNKGKMGSYIQYSYPITKGGVYTITVGVKEPSDVATFKLNGGGPIVGIREVTCASAKH